MRKNQGEVAPGKNVKCDLERWPHIRHLQHDPKHRPTLLQNAESTFATVFKSHQFDRISIDKTSWRRVSISKREFSLKNLSKVNNKQWKMQKKSYFIFHSEFGVADQSNPSWSISHIFEKYFLKYDFKSIFFINSVSEFVQLLA